ncbi:hypothetical protein [Nocardia sp. NPDC050717]|uniref:hypothetical protein n=1 Tax=Nocardia sp. NPDC050717 TaxID=3157221 RepID=UPI0033E83F3A
MAEVFSARPGHIAGLSNLVKEIGDDAGKCGTFVRTEGPPKGELFTGVIISDLLTPLQLLCDMTSGRMSDLGTHTISTSTELNKAAWMYHNQDMKTYQALNQHTHDVPSATPQNVDGSTEKVGTTDPYTAAENYPKKSEFKLEAPNVNREDLAGLIGEVSPVIGDVNESIKSVTRTVGEEFDPLAKLLTPIEGNWNEVRRIGEVYKAAGNAMEICGVNLEEGVKKVGPNWDGKAAISFETNWANRQIAAMKWEGPVGRLIADLFGRFADSIRNGIKRALTALKEMLEDYLDIKSIKGIFKQVIKKIPGLGAIAEVMDLAHKILTIMNKVKAIVDEIEQAKNQLKEFLSFLQNPTQVAADNLNQRLEPALRQTARAVDLNSAVRVNNTLDRPRESYEVGAGTDPWSNG